MKKSVLIILLISLSTFIKAQTWSKKLNWQNHFIYIHADSATGVKDAALMPNGKYAIIAQVNQEEKNELMVLDTLSGSIQWRKDLGSWGGLSSQYVTSILATSDTGIVACRNYYSNSFSQTSGLIVKFSSIGDTIWTASFPAVQYQHRYASGVVETSSGNYLALVGDSVFELNPSTGATINIFPALQQSRRLFLVPGSTDYVVSGVYSVGRFSNSGNLIWAYYYQMSFYQSSAVTANGFYTLFMDTLILVNITTGVLINILSLPPGRYSTINPSPSGDLYVARGCKVHWVGGGSPESGAILKLDSAGNILWTKNIPITKFGLSWVNEMPGGKLFCSGAYLLTENLGNPLDTTIDYMPFCLTTDLNGNGIMDSTTYLWPGDANQNHFVQFADDALYIQQSFGRTGYVRDTIIYSTLFHGLDHSAFMADWSTVNTAGVNDKFCDVSGDGLIDNADLNAFTYWYGAGVPVIYRTSLLPDLTFAPVNSVVPAGDTARFYVIAGMTTPLDSVSGIAFSNYSIANFPYLSSQFLTNTLGIPGVDTRIFSSSTINYCSANCAASRIDRTNHHLANDTLCIISFLIPSNTLDTVFSTTIVGVKAIRGDGSDVPVEAVNGMITISHSVGINKLNAEKLIIYPNPSNDKITLDKNYAGKHAEIFNSSDKKVIDVLISGNGVIDVHELAAGNYYVKVESMKTSSFKFIKL